jgi:hypothetical protein
MGVSVTVTFACGGCEATATAPEQAVRREFVSLSGRDHGVGGYVVTPILIESAAPEGWVAFDPFTQCTYCPVCWAAITDAQVAPADAGEALAAAGLPVKAVEWAAGDKAIWTGTKGLFRQEVEIEEVFRAGLLIMGETPGTGEVLCHLKHPTIGTVFSIPAWQLEQVPAAEQATETAAAAGSETCPGGC